MNYTIDMSIRLQPVGKVENNIKTNHKFDATDVTSRIIIDPAYCSALDSIESFSHIIVLFWLHKVEAKERLILKVHPRRDTSLPLTGVFATRSPVRPNPIGITTARLIKRDGNVLTVKGLDAIDGTPVLDIKPYIPESIPQSEISLANWL
jgi:tRNA (adenine37-N6)-methyltransferase